METILLYISMIIKVIILIILIAILVKINTLSSIKTIEKFDDYKGPEWYNPNKDKTLTKVQYDKLNDSSTSSTTIIYMDAKNSRLQNTTYDEINKLITEFTELANNSETDLNTLNTLSKPFPSKKFTYLRSPPEYKLTMDKSKIFDYLKTINDNFKNIKEITDKIIVNSNKVRYIYYNYYTTYWKQNSDLFPVDSNGKKAIDLYTPFIDVLTRISNAEEKAIDNYLFAKGFLNMKEGTKIYNTYKNALDNNIIYNDYLNNQSYTGKIKFDLNKEYYINKYDKYSVDYAPYFYVWQAYDYKTSKYIAESERPSIKLKNGTIHTYRVI